MARKRRRTRAILGGVLVLVLAGAAATVFALDVHQAHKNDRQKKAVAAETRAAAGVQMVGVVTAVNGKSVVVRLSTGGSRRLNVGASTTIENATTGSDTDLKAGTRGVLSMQLGYLNKAEEILVLPNSANLGKPIARAGYGFVWVREKGGQLSPRIEVGGATVDHATRAALADVKAGAHVVAHVRALRTKPVRYVANEIVLLPADTSFVS